jgi:uncharacterized membrane protein
MHKFRILHPYRHRPASGHISGTPDNPELADVIERNIITLVRIRQEEEARKRLGDHVADGITAFSGSMLFVYLHVVIFGAWIFLNTIGLKKPFDPFPFNLLTMVVSLEAIFLSTFVLVSQNRMAAVADKRADLDLQINLLAEHEITHVLKLVDAIAEHLGIKQEYNPEVEELEKDITPEELLKEMERRQRESKGR